MNKHDRDYYIEMGKKGGRPKLPTIESLLEKQAALEANERRRMQPLDALRHQGRLR